MNLVKRLFNYVQFNLPPPPKKKKKKKKKMTIDIWELITKEPVWLYEINLRDYEITIISLYILDSEHLLRIVPVVTKKAHQMKTFKCVFLSSTQSGPNPFWKGALHILDSEHLLRDFREGTHGLSRALPLKILASP